jgi:RND family efflux transporter MFP subunit
MKNKQTFNQFFEKVKSGLPGSPIPARTYWIMAAGLAVIAGLAGFFVWRQISRFDQASTGAVNTTIVRKGNIIISAAGSGKLTAVLSNDLGFPVDGYLGELNVRVGDKVAKGQELARLADLTTLEAAAVSAEQDLVTAEAELDDLIVSAPLTLGNAQLAVAEDKKAVKDAESALLRPGLARCDDDEIQAYYYAWQKAKDSLADLGDASPSNNDYYLKVVVPAKDAVLKSYATYEYCAGYTEYEIEASEANLAIAKAQLARDQSTLELLRANDGLDPTALATAKNKVKNAEVALKDARQDLEEAVITAPFAGIITAIKAQVGDKIETGSFITIADVTHPQVEFAIDETDMSVLALDAIAEVTFDAIENKTYTGKIILINPSLQETNGYATVAGTIQLDLANDEELPISMQGLTASVKIIKGKAENTLLIPVQALREIGDGEYAVYMVDDAGKMTLKTVSVGLMDSVNAEILSGLAVGDRVSTGLSETKQ